jgi:hypothetical protein
LVLGAPGCASERGSSETIMLDSLLKLVAWVVVSVLAMAAAPAYSQCTAVPATDWKTNIDYANEPFIVNNSYTPEEPRWVKFAILLCDPATVYFQNGYTYRFHYDFARVRLNPFLGMSAAQFDNVTLHAAGQQAVLGAVLVPGYGLFGETQPVREMAIQLVRQDAYTREQVRDYFNLVKSRVLNAEGVPTFYFPTFEQEQAAETDRAWLSSQGIEVAGPERWIRTNACYAQGWAVGTLKFVTGAQVGDAYLNGTLRASDILLTDAVPAEAPPVAGIVTLNPATPNSHVALLSQTWGIPFAYLAGDAGAAAQALVGRRVILRSHVVQYACRADLTDAESLSQPVLDELFTMKEIPPLDYDPTQPLGVPGYFVGIDALTPADTDRVGGKAANYGVLRRAIPANVRPAAAIGFDLWNEYLNQPMLGGLTLRQTIANRLAAHQAWPPTDPQALSTALSEVRNLFTSTSTTSFTATQQMAVLAALQNPAYGFDPDVKIRFRSSTNVEDTTSFTGAGLYDSFSGCLRDDIDADTVGPSACDPAEANERGVFRAIRRVFASFYNDNAYQARRRLSVNENEVGMAMLVHHSFPDSTELANGVAVISHTPPSGYQVKIVTQLGAVSVTNPEDGSTPEEVSVYISGGNYYPELERSCSRVVLGDKVMNFPSDYSQLASLMLTVLNRYRQENAISGPLSLDFEFKKTTPNGALEIKQVRPLPLPSTIPSITPILIDRPERWCLFQGETSNVLANHRMKTQLMLGSDSLRLSAANLTQSFMGQASDWFNSGCRVSLLSGAMEQWPGASWSFAAGTASQSWRVGAGPGVTNPRTYTLEFEGVPTLVSPAASPVVYLSDFGLGNRHLVWLRAQYDQPVPYVDWDNQIRTTLTDEVRLCPCPDPDGLPVHRTITADGVTVDIQFSWVPGGAAAGYTFDLASWSRTIITGLTTRPITLTSPWSQTYRPGHHNFTEDYVFDPRLEPGIAPAILQELSQQNVAYLMVRGVGTTMPRVVRMTETCLPCPADWDASGSVSVQDLFTFLAAWFGGDPRADWDGSGALGVQDLFDYLAAFFVGC